MKHPCNRNEESMERVLGSFRGAEVPAGMEDRILRRLEVQASERLQTRQQNPLRAWIFKPTTYIVSGLALASLLIAVSYVHSARRPEETPLQQQQSLSPIASRQPSNSEIGNSETVDGQLPNRLTAQAARAAKPKTNSIAQAEPLSDEDALALSEMLAPSKPAPPLPLTGQEKLLTEAVHQAGPEELSSLRPEVRARAMELSKAEFHDFFEPPPAKDNE